MNKKSNDRNCKKSEIVKAEKINQRCHFLGRFLLTLTSLFQTQRSTKMFISFQKMLDCHINPPHYKLQLILEILKNCKNNFHEQIKILKKMKILYYPIKCQMILMY